MGAINFYMSAWCFVCVSYYGSLSQILYCIILSLNRSGVISNVRGLGSITIGAELAATALFG